MNALYLSLSALLMMNVPNCLGQPSTLAQVSIGTRMRDITGLRTLEEIMPNIDRAKLLTSAPANWEGQIIEAGRRSAAVVIRPGIGSLTGYYTVATKTGDALVASWKPATNGQVENAIWLWDTPYVTGFILEVDTAVLNFYLVGRSAVRNSCELWPEMLAWRKVSGDRTWVNASVHC